jgi:xanthine dehydrogenase accessory factor
MVTEDAGSTPRDAGAWILVSREATLGTLGGGQLEQIAEDAAKELLDDPGRGRRSTLRCILGPDARQCCGGAVKLALELLDANTAPWLKKAAESIQSDTDDAVLFPTGDASATPRVISASRSVAATAGVHLQSLRDTRPRLFLFGAGHVGRSLCTIASQLPLRLVAFDSRDTMRALVPRADNVTVADMTEPEICVRSIPHNAAVLVMTHSHELDYELCRALLRRNDLAFVGLIGSHSKAARFRHRLRKDGLSPRAADRLTSPIGTSGPTSKEPGVIALAALTEILTVFEELGTENRVEVNSQSDSVSNQQG